MSIDPAPGDKRMKAIEKRGIDLKAPQPDIRISRRLG
jgi:hypothetical protein